MAKRGTDFSGGGSDAGFTLVAVLWIILAIAAILTPLSLKARTQAAHTAALQQVDRLNTLAEGIATVLISQYRTALTRQQPDGISANSARQACKSGALLLSYRLQSHAGLLNVNTSGQSTLAQAFIALGQNRADADALAKKTIFHRSYSGNASLETQTGVLGGPKKAPLESLSELYDIEDMRGISYRDLRETFTVHSKSNTLALQAVPRHLEPILQEGSPVQAVTWDAAALLSSPVTVSVIVQRGIHRGQFNGLYATRTARSALGDIVETWRYDSPEPSGSLDEAPDCKQSFGHALHDALEAFG